MRKPVIAGNWKMNKTRAEGVRFVQHLKELFADESDIDVIVCPPYTALAEINNVLSDSSIGLGAQDIFWEEEGAFTGEVSANMLKDAGCRYTIVGHSERRLILKQDTDETVNRKLSCAIRHELIPILCIGETLKEREAGLTQGVVRSQTEKALQGLNGEDIRNIIIAYEPVWAIGTGRTATPNQAQEVHSFLRRLLSDMYGYSVASGLRILYGGSVKTDNIAELMKEEDIDGALVGGSSLDLESFIQLVRNAARVKLCMP